MIERLLFPFLSIKMVERTNEVGHLDFSPSSSPHSLTTILLYSLECVL